jgi:hypothetical protein
VKVARTVLKERCPVVISASTLTDSGAIAKANRVYMIEPHPSGRATGNTSFSSEPNGN